jgi:hypothetical protein
MQEFIRHFVREPDGAWQCVSPATLETATGRIQVTPGSRFTRGTIFMGVEIAAWLDMQAASAFRNGMAGQARGGALQSRSR